MVGVDEMGGVGLSMYKEECGVGEGVRGEEVKKWVVRWVEEGLEGGGGVL